ncbi:MAG: DUF86 domain-containing protein [Candidatus Eremiobacteraeota bacterium]|nr:DUF86 domain-containing protein [Candidatus Eremiobacteraeota bacterium]
MSSHLLDLEKYLVLLASQEHATLEEINGSPFIAYGIQHVIQISIETIFNITHHIIAACNFDTPKSNIESLEILAKEGILKDPELLESLKKMARFRNLVVHRYWEVDNEKILEILRRDLGDLRKCADSIGLFLRNNPEL